MSPECPHPCRDWQRAAVPGPGSSAADRRLGPLISTPRWSLTRCRWEAPIRCPGWRPLEIIRFQGQTRRGEPEYRNPETRAPSPTRAGPCPWREKHVGDKHARGESNKAVDGETRSDSPPRWNIISSTTTVRTFAESAGNRQFYVTRQRISTRFERQRREKLKIRVYHKLEPEFKISERNGERFTAIFFDFSLYWRK